MGDTDSDLAVNKSPPMLVVAGALALADGRVLLQQRPEGRQHAGLWEFPGGKVEPGETPEAALVRELGEELGIRVDPAALSPAAFVTAPLPGRTLILLLYRVAAWAGEPRALDAAALAWVPPAAMAAWPMPPADYPLAAYLAGA